MKKDQEADTAKPNTEKWKLREIARDYILECRKHIGETDFYCTRGLSAETIERFGLGYDPDRRLAVIPFSMSYYTCRSVDVPPDTQAPHKHAKPKGLRQPLFNVGALAAPTVFVVESPLDAMSITQVGGAALALGGTSTALFGKVVRIYRPEGHFVLACDNDAAGREAVIRLADILDACEVAFSLPEHGSFRAFKDANATLMACEEALRSGVQAETSRILPHGLEARHRFGEYCPKPIVSPRFLTAASG